MKIWVTVLYKLEIEKDFLSFTSKYKLKRRIGQGLGVQFLEATTWFEILVPHTLAL